MATWYRSESDRNLEIGDWVLATYYGDTMVMEVSRIKFSTSGEVVGYKLKPSRVQPRASSIEDLERQVQIHNQIAGTKAPAQALSLAPDAVVQYPYINRDPSTWAGPTPNKKVPEKFSKELWSGAYPGIAELVDQACAYLSANISRLSPANQAFAKSYCDNWLDIHDCTDPMKPYYAKYMMIDDAFVLDGVFSSALDIADYPWILDPAEADSYGNWEIRTSDGLLKNFLGADARPLCGEWFKDVRAPFADVPELGKVAAEVVRAGDELVYLDLDGCLYDVNGTPLEAAPAKARRRKSVASATTDDNSVVEIVDKRDEREGIAVVEFDDGRFGYLDVASNILLCDQDCFGDDVMYWNFEEVRPFKNGFGVVRGEKGWNALTKDGDLINPTDVWYDELGDFEDVGGAIRAECVLRGRKCWLDKYGHPHRLKK